MHKVHICTIQARVGLPFYLSNPCIYTVSIIKHKQLFRVLLPSTVTGTFRCTFCQTEVEEDNSVCPDARTLVARFNEQIEPIYALLRETEDVNLSHDLLEPEPSEIPALKQRSVFRKTLLLFPNSQHHLCPTKAKFSNYLSSCFIFQ